MKTEKKLIGLCVTHINSEHTLDLIESLQKILRENGDKLLVFNSSRDFADKSLPQGGARAVFTSINFDMLDLLIVVKNWIYDEEIIAQMVRGAKRANVPVVMLGGSFKDCYEVKTCGEKALGELVRHVVVDHGVKDIFFVGGSFDNAETIERVSVVKETMKSLGLELDEAHIGYGEFWEEPTRALIDKIIEEGRVPKAFICANDVMAFETIRVLGLNGIKVPNDVIVTGYDGLVASKYSNPSLTTCMENKDDIVRACLEIMKDSSENGISPRLVTVEHDFYIGESCGCTSSDDDSSYKKQNKLFYREIYEGRRHENELFEWLETAIHESDIKNIRWTLQRHILTNAYLCLKKDFIVGAFEEYNSDDSKPYGDFLQVFIANDDHYRSVEIPDYPVKDMIPELDTWLEDDTVAFISSIFVDMKPLGCYVVKSADTRDACHKINRIATVVNIAFRSVFSKISQQNMLTKLENFSNINPISKLRNMKGFIKWFSEFSDVAENHQRAISVSIYNIKRYKYILENYGMDDIEEIVSFISKAFRASVRPENTMLAQITEDDFVVFNYADFGHEEQIQEMISETTNSFYEIIGGFNAVNGKPYAIEVNAGCTWSNPGWNQKIGDYIKLANGNLYLNRLRYGSDAITSDTSSKSKEDVDENKQKELEAKFKLLLEKNLFNYFFQPLVDAHTGEIYAYEALMRTTKEVGLFPLEILDLATKNQKLYSIEYATFFNVFERLHSDFESFKGRKIFINTIPGYFLSTSDLNVLRSKYSRLMNYGVIELTEGESLDDDEIEVMKGLCSDDVGCMLAVDDYGTGHSNIVNVLRYEPQVIKIDRYLITDIHKDNNKQMFVRNAIDFARANHIKVVAEGVETLDELNMVIRLGVDLIQGYYTAKPAPEPLDDIPAEIKQQIVEAYEKHQKEEIERYGE